MKQLVQHLATGTHRLIGIDGHLGVGKSSFSEHLSSALGIPVLHLDEFVESGNQESYVERINYKRLAQAIDASNGKVIIEGVCLLACLGNIDYAPDFLVYLTLQSESSTADDRLKREVSEYHTQHAPQREANIVMALNNTSQSDSNIDALYIKSKTTISLVLATGGILSIIFGGLVLIMGSTEAGESLMKLGGLEISSKGAGSVVMATSVLWGYFSFLARPVYNRVSEKSMARGADGSYKELQRVSVTQAVISHTDKVTRTRNE